MKELHRKSLYHYATALFVFLCYLGMCIAVFFYGIQHAVEGTTRAQLAENVTKQCDHLKDVIGLEFENLEGVAAYLGGQENPVKMENGDLLRAMVSESAFVRMTYGTKDGTGYASDLPELQDMSGQAFFKEAMKGSRVVSDPIESPLDGTDLIVLAVPVYDSSGGVTGVLAGSFDVSRLSEIFFGDLYGGAGYVYIINSAGESIMMDKKHGEDRRGKTFFAFYSDVTFEKGDSLAQVQADLAAGTGAVRRVRRDEDIRYLTYEPVGYNNWFVCYVVPEKNAQQAYAFIRDYEIVLSLFVVAGLIILLAVLQYTNVRDRRLLEVKAQTDAMTGLLNAVSTRENVDVWLKNGAYLVIQPTEALTVVDVNSGKYSAKTKKKSAETYLKINLEAAKETARQIRLRNISGIILIDFINMDDLDMMQELLKQFRRFLGEDPIQTSVVDVTALQLVEVTRKKVRRPLHECVRDKAEKSPERSEHVE